MSETHTLEVFLAVDVDGDWRAAADEAEAITLYGEEVGSLPIRVVKINVTLTLPEIAEASVTVPDEAGRTVTAEVAS